MSDLFTVKLDLSAVTRNENEKLYILMVDPARMKMIYQFKLWIRFLFSIDCPIKLIYEGATIHDLEDVHILTLLKTVRVEVTDYGVGEREQREQLIAKLNRYDEWRERVTPSATPEKQCELMNGIAFQTANRQLHRLGVSRVDQNEFNLSNEECHRREITSQYPASISSQNEGAKQISMITNGDLNNSSNSCVYNGIETERADHYYKKSENKIQSQKDDECSNVTFKSTPKIATGSGKTGNLKSKHDSSVKRSANKPFSLYNFLQSLRTQESVVDDDNQIKNDFNVSDVKVKDSITNFEDEGEGNGKLIKKKRKRIRKHKNQKNKIHSQAVLAAQALTPPFHESQIMKSLSVSPKPKHIRFDDDNDEDDSGNSVGNKAVKEESIILKDYSNECLYNNGNDHSNVHNLNDEELDVMPSGEQDDCVNETNTVIGATVQVIENTQGNETDIKDLSVNEENEEVKSESLNNSPQSILDIFGSLRKKGSLPPVFDRFANCV